MSYLISWLIYQGTVVTHLFILSWHVSKYLLMFCAIVEGPTMSRCIFWQVHFVCQLFPIVAWFLNHHFVFEKLHNVWYTLVHRDWYSLIWLTVLFRPWWDLLLDQYNVLLLLLLLFYYLFIIIYYFSYSHVIDYQQKMC